MRVQDGGTPAAHPISMGAGESAFTLCQGSGLLRSPALAWLLHPKPPRLGLGLQRRLLPLLLQLLPLRMVPALNPFFLCKANPCSYSTSSLSEIRPGFSHMGAGTLGAHSHLKTRDLPWGNPTEKAEGGKQKGLLAASPGDKGHDAGTAQTPWTTPAERDKPHCATGTLAWSHPKHLWASQGTGTELGQGTLGQQQPDSTSPSPLVPIKISQQRQGAAGLLQDGGQQERGSRRIRHNTPNPG